MAASIIDITPGELVPSSKMRKSAAKASLELSKELEKDVSCHTKSGNLGFEPEGPPECEKMEESASHHFNFYFARQRAETDENDALNLREIAQNVQNSEF